MQIIAQSRKQFLARNGSTEPLLVEGQKIEVVPGANGILFLAYENGDDFLNDNNEVVAVTYREGQIMFNNAAPKRLLDADADVAAATYLSDEESEEEEQAEANANAVPPRREATPPPVAAPEAARDPAPATFLGGVWALIAGAPSYAKETLVYAATPRTVAKQYSGYVGKWAALALFYQGLDFVAKNSTIIQTVMEPIVRAAVPQFSIAVDLVAFASASEFVVPVLMASAVAATMDKETVGGGWKSGKDAGKDYVKDKLKKFDYDQKKATNGYFTFKEWRDWGFGKLVDIGGLVGGTFGAAYTVFLAQSAIGTGVAVAEAGGVTFAAANLGNAIRAGAASLTTTAGIWAAMSALAAASVTVAGMAVAAVATGFLLVLNKEIYDFVGGVGAGVGIQQADNVFDGINWTANKTTQGFKAAGNGTYNVGAAVGNGAYNKGAAVANGAYNKGAEFANGARAVTFSAKESAGNAFAAAREAVTTRMPAMPSLRRAPGL